MNQFMFNPESLAQLGQLPIEHTSRGYDWMQMARQADQATLADIAAQRQRQAEMHPLEVAQKQATLADTQAITQGRQIANEWAPKVNQADLDAKLFKLTQDKSEEEIKNIEREAYKLMTSDDPRKQEMGRAVYERMPAVLEKRKTAAQEKELAQMENATRLRGQDTQVKVAEIGARSREQVAATRSAMAQQARSDVTKMNAEQFISKYTEIMNAAIQAGDMETAQQARDMIEFRRAVSPAITGAPMPNPEVFQSGGQPLQVPRPEVTVPQVPTRQPQQPAPQPKADGPVKVTSQEDYNKLPPGALYLHPDGTTRRKRP